MLRRRKKLFGGARFNPLVYSPALWLDASDQSTLFQDRTGASASTPVASNADPVGTWKDKSGNARHAVAASDSVRPSYTTGVTNGLPGISGDGVDDCLTIATSTSVFNFLHNAQGTVLAVIKPGTTSDPNVLIPIIGNNATASANIGYLFAYDDRAASSFNNAIRNTIVRGVGATFACTNSGNDVVTPNTFSVVSDVLDLTQGVAASRSALRVNGGTAIQNNSNTSAASGSNATYNMQVFAGGNNAGIQGPLVLCELLIYSTALSSTQRQQVERYLGNKWGITVA